jgi:hypothetical protein
MHHQLVSLNPLGYASLSAFSLYDELTQLQNMEDSMICKVLMPDRSHKAIFVNSYTTVRDAFTDLSTRIDLAQYAKHFSLFEVDEQQGT